jgi:Ca2+-binding RTX toxin-like protein
MPIFTYKPIGGNGANTLDYLDFLVDYNNTVTFSDAFFRKTEGPGNTVVLQATGMVWSLLPILRPIEGTLNSLRMTNGGDVIWTITNWNLSAQSFFEAAIAGDATLFDLVLSKNDTVTGTNFDDFLLGGGGADRMYGGLGGDELSGGDGRDAIFGGNGLDYLIGGNGNDSLFGGNGQSNLQGEVGNDSLYGGTLGDSLQGGTGSMGMVVMIMPMAVLALTPTTGASAMTFSLPKRAQI